jgi:hypothetical protein
MWATFALSTILNLAPAQAGGLEVQNVRFTQSALGAVRRNNKFLPGDLVVLSFAVEGLEPTGVSRVRYGMGLELRRKGADKPEYSKPPQDHESITGLGGTDLPLHAVSSIGTDTPPGTYVMKVSVVDRVGKGSVAFEREFEVLPLGLGFVRVGLSYHAELPAPPVAVPGQTLFLNFGLVGFALDKKTGQPDMTIELQPLDEKGKPTTAKPFRGEVRRGKEGFEQFIPFDPIAVPVHRAGKFQLALKVTDNIAKKTAEHTLDLTVLNTK